MEKEAWVTSAVEDDAVEKSIVLAGSLRRVQTTRPLVVLTTLAVCENLRNKLKEKFDRVVMLDQKNPNGLKLEEYAKVHAFSLVDFKKCVYLSPNALVLKNCDEIFGKYISFAASNTTSGEIDHSIFVYTPSLELNRNLGKIANSVRDAGGFSKHFSLSLKNNVPIEEMDRQFNWRLHINGTATKSMTSNAAIVNFDGLYPLELSKTMSEMGAAEKVAIDTCKKIYMEEIKSPLNGYTNGSVKNADKKSTEFTSGIKKFSGKRGELHPSVFDWLETKRRDDDIGPNLWRVHNKLYDLEKFIDRHPGGRDWLELTRGTDITEAFESSHFVNLANVEMTLAKFYVRDINTPRNSPYTFKEDGFYRTLKRKAEPILKKVGMEPSTEAKMYIDALALTYVALAITGAIMESATLCILAGTFLGMTMSSSHNFFHKKDNWRRFYWDMSTLSSYEWRVSHSISHHNFPNTILDFEVILGEPMIEMLPIRPKTFFHKYIMPGFIHVLYFVMGLAELPYRFLSILQGKQKLRPENLIVLLEIAIITTISPSYWAAFKALAFIGGFSTFWLTFTGNNSSHHHPECFHDGDQTRSNMDYGLCQIDATASKTDWYHKTFFSVLTTYGEHPLHHLFPTVCHGKLKYLKPIMEETLEEFKEDLLEFSQYQIFVGTLKQLGRTTPNPHREYKRA